MTNQWEGASEEYLKYLRSEDGQVQSQITDEWVVGKLGSAPLTILDAGCGSGDLASKLVSLGHSVAAFDVSEELINSAKTSYPQIDFRVGSLEDTDFNYDQRFYVIVCNLVLMNVQDLGAVFKKLSGWLTPNGKILVSVVNPYYGYPVGIWKRGIWGRIAGRLPRLIIRDYFAEHNRIYQIPFGDNLITNYRHTMPEYILAINKAGLVLKDWQDLGYKGDLNNPTAHRARQAALFVGWQLDRDIV